MNAHTPTLKPLGIPPRMNPSDWRQSVENRLNDLLDRNRSLITALDLMEADCDLEETADDEPSLGWTERGGHGLASYLAPNLPAGDVLDLEMDNSDDEEGGDEEPMMGAIERHPTSRESPWGRSGELTVPHYSSNSQEDWAGSRATLPGHDEREAENEHGGDVLDEPHDRVEGEPSLGWTNHIDQRLSGKVDPSVWFEDGEFDSGHPPEQPGHN